MSLPECRLVLAEHAKVQALELMQHTRSRQLATAAKWSGVVAAELNKFCAELHAIAEPMFKDKSQRATTSNVLKFFGGLGLAPVAS